MEGGTPHKAEELRPICAHPTSHKDYIVAYMLHQQILQCDSETVMLTASSMCIMLHVSTINGCYKSLQGSTHATNPV